MKKIIVLLFTFIGITACSINKHIDSSGKRVKEDADTFILQQSSEKPLIDSIGHSSHRSHVSHYSQHYSHYSSN